MFYKKIAVITLGSLIAACSTAPQQLLSEQTLFLPQQFELQLKDNTPGTQQEFGEISLHYMELENADSYAAEEKINKAIRAMAGMNEAYSGNTDVSTRVKLSKLTNNYALVVMETYSYRHGAANGETKIQSAYFDLKTGNRVNLKQLLLTNYQEPLNQEIIRWLEENEIQHEFSGLTDDSCFYQKNGKSYFCFSQYEIAAGAEGVINVPIKTEIMTHWINQNGLLGQ